MNLIPMSLSTVWPPPTSTCGRSVCACYPNLSAQAPYKLAPWSTRCVFLVYYADHKCYQCLDLSTNSIIVFQYIVFDEADFPFAASPCLTNDLDIFL
jgi:hypothetical protein